MTEEKKAEVSKKIEDITNRQDAVQEERQRLIAEIEYDIETSIQHLKDIQGGGVAYDFVIGTLAKLKMPF